MFTKKILWLTTLTVITLGLGMIGCSGDDGEQGPAGPAATSKATMYGWVELGGEGWFSKTLAAGDEVSAVVHIGDIPGIPVVTANGTTLGFEPELSVYGGGMGFMGITTTNASNAVDIAAAFTKTDGTAGEATASITVVDSFAIVSPPADSYVYLSMGDDLTVTWESAQNATEYWARGYFECDYTDTLGNDRDYEWQFNLILTDTTCTFVADSIFGDTSDVATLDYLYGDFDVYAVSGPSMTGGPGNVTGDGMGLVMSVSYGGDLDIEDASGVPTKKEVDEAKPDFAEIFRQNVIERQ